MTDNDQTKDDSQAGGALQKLVTSATDAFVDSVSSLAGSAIDEGAKRVNDFTLDVCKQHLDKMARERSIVNAGELTLDKVSMSPMISEMLKVCITAVCGCTWVVCAPTDQGKTAAAEFLIHGKHSVRPTRSLKIDATNMADFAKKFAGDVLNCSAAEAALSQHLCEALTADSAPIASSGEGKLAKATSKVTNLAGQYVCTAAQSIPFSKEMEIRKAEQHRILKVKSCREGGEPSPVLIIDEFYINSEKNKAFVRTLLRDAAAMGVTVFLMTKDADWASELIKLNGGTKCKPLPGNVRNQGYTGSQRFEGEAEWNSMDLSVEEQREVVQDFCQKHDLDPIQVIPNGSRFSPGEAMKRAGELYFEKQMSIV